jgi:flagellar biosynthesis protein FlhG
VDGAGVARLEALLRSALPGLDEIVIDLGAGLDAGVRRLAARADLLLVVATEEPTSLTDAYAVLKLHRQDAPGGQARVVVNLASSPAAGARTWQTLDRACRQFLGAGVALAGVIRRDPKVPEAIRRQTALLTRHPDCPASADLHALARGLLAAEEAA